MTFEQLEYRRISFWAIPSWIFIGPEFDWLLFEKLMYFNGHWNANEGVILETTHFLLVRGLIEINGHLIGNWTTPDKTWTKEKPI